ncbi:hypothetical protein ACEWY4_028085 [Coilia grayii]|uniref:Reverse transcriptase/retrotransposon-derived protein RNase H-like domain-containing protein n=1 Tax=Coilia grayii TaxID=363190 RepID=A0ABD1IMU7_9TELE
MLHKDSGISHIGTTITEDEELTPSLENFVVLTWRRLIHADLPKLVKQRYGTELRSRTLASIKPEISQALDSLLDELQATEDVRAMRTAVTAPPKPGLSRSVHVRKSCPLCKQAKRPGNHFLSKCAFLPPHDKAYMAKTRQVLGEPRHDSDDDVSDEPVSGDMASPSIIQRVLIKQSPYLDAFHDHLPVRLTIDSGATGNMMRSSCATRLGVTITGSTQSAHQADGSSPLKVLGETRTYFQRDSLTLYFEGLVVENLDSDVLAGIPFMEVNDVSIRPAKHQVCLGDNVFCYGSNRTAVDRHAVQRAHVLRVSAKAAIWPGEYIELDLPPELCDLEGELAVEPHIDTSHNLADAHIWPAPAMLRSVSGKIRIPNSTGQPQLTAKHAHVCRVHTTYMPSLDTTAPIDNYKPTPIVRSTLHSDCVVLDPDNVMRPTVQDQFGALHREFDGVFDPQFTGYNGAVGPFQAKVNMGPVQPSQRKGRVPQYFRGQLQELQAHLYVRSAMGMPGSETALEELTCRVLGNLLEQGHVAKVADDLYCGADTLEELLTIWRGVLSALQHCGLNLSSAKTTIAPIQTNILGWVWRQGTIQASPHRVSALASCPPPKSVTGLRSFTGAYKVLARVIKHCSTLLALDEVVAGRDSKDIIQWTNESLSGFNRAQNALSTNHAIALPRPDDQLWIVTDGAVRNPGLGATLYITRNDRARVAGYFGAKLRKNQYSWLPCEIEALSIAAAVKHFDPFIVQASHKACVLTDSKPCVQAFEKLCRGEFSASPRVTTFLSTASRFQVLIRHVAGASILPSDYHVWTSENAIHQQNSLAGYPVRGLRPQTDMCPSSPGDTPR